MHKFVLRKSLIPYFVAVAFIFFPFLIAGMAGVFGVVLPAYAVLMCISLFLLFAGTNYKLSNIFVVHKINFVLFLFFVWICYSYTYSVASVSSKEKLILVFYNTIIPIFIICLADLLCPKKVQSDKIPVAVLLKSCYALAFLGFILLVTFGSADESGRATIPGVENPIWVSRFFGMLCLVVLLLDPPRKSNLVFLIPFILVVLLSLKMAGSRTPVLALIIVYLFQFAYKNGALNTIPYVIFAALVGAIGFTFSSSYLFDLNFYSVYARFDILLQVYEVNWDPMLGFGLGSFGQVILGEDKMFYPHNLLIEILFETGVVGFGIVILLAYYFVKRFTGTVFDYLVIYFFILSMTSGDIVGNNTLFLLIFCSALFGGRYSNSQPNSRCYL